MVVVVGVLLLGLFGRKWWCLLKGRGGRGGGLLHLLARAGLVLGLDVLLGVVEQQLLTTQLDRVARLLQFELVALDLVDHLLLVPLLQLLQLQLCVRRARVSSAVLCVRVRVRCVRW